MLLFLDVGERRRSFVVDFDVVVCLRESTDMKEWVVSWNDEMAPRGLIFSGLGLVTRFTCFFELL